MINKFKSDSGYYQNQPSMGGLVSRMSLSARQKMFAALMRRAQPNSKTTVLDVGVTSDRRQESNFFEKLYPYPSQITAVGLEDAYFLEEEYPGLKYVKADGLSLPFPDKSFDLIVCFAVIEHLGNQSWQTAMIHELCRVGKTVCVTTPNRWYPIEFHTVTPLIHWLPPLWFRKILRFFGQNFYAKEENLNLLGERDLSQMFPANFNQETINHRLFGLVSNLVFYCVEKSP